MGIGELFSTVIVEDVRAREHDVMNVQKSTV